MRRNANPHNTSTRPLPFSALILVLLLGLGLYLANGAGKFFSAGPRHNVILILLDTLRADRLGAYGNPSGLTPELDAFAQDAVLFENAYAHAPWTLPSVASIFTAQTPLQHGAGGRLGAFAVLEEKAVTLAEVFQRSGAKTAAITNVLFLGPSFGAMQGFDDLDHAVPSDNKLTRVAESTTETALGWLDANRTRRFFLFVHYFDPHLTYDPPQPFREKFAAPEDKGRGRHLFGTVGEMVAFRRGQIHVADSQVERLEKLYNGDVAYMDQMLGKLFDGIEARGLLKDTIIVVTADHGEEFGEHKGFEHGHTLYDELLHVPLLIREPGPAGGLRVETAVRHIDLAPTLTDLAGIDAPAFGGSSLAPLLRGEKEADRPVLSAGNMWGPSQTSWRSAGFKLFRKPGGKPASLYDLESDPAEKTDLLEREKARAAALDAELDLVLSALAGEERSGAAPELSEVQRAQLRALGYLQ